jgi:hypothetical protein
MCYPAASLYSNRWNENLDMKFYSELAVTIIVDIQQIQSLWSFYLIIIDEYNRI